MHTQNINVNGATEASRIWAENHKMKIERIIERAHFNVACAEEAHAHYGEKFTRFDALFYFVQGALGAIFHKS